MYVTYDEKRLTKFCFTKCSKSLSLNCSIKNVTNVSMKQFCFVTQKICLFFVVFKIFFAPLGFYNKYKHSGAKCFIL